MRRKSADCFS
jgi:hypothetical protein